MNYITRDDKISKCAYIKLDSQEGEEKIIQKESDKFPRNEEKKIKISTQNDINLTLKENNDKKTKISTKTKDKAWIEYKMLNYGYKVGCAKRVIDDEPVFFADYRGPFHLLKKAAEFGHPGGQYYYAVCFMYGLGCEKSKQKAIEWFSKAYMNGVQEAEYYLKKLIESKDGSCEIW